MSNPVMLPRRRDDNKMNSSLRICVNPKRQQELSNIANILQIHQCQKFPLTPLVSPSRRKPTSCPISPTSPLANSNFRFRNVGNISSPSVPKSPRQTIFNYEDQLSPKEQTMGKLNSSLGNDNDEFVQNSYSTDCSKVIKFGNLVLLLPRSSTNSSPQEVPLSIHSRRTMTRCPVSVKIHKKAFEKYAIISQSKRHKTSPPVFVNLRHALITQNENSPSMFYVVLNGVDGRYLQLEASSPEAAQDWVEAFSSNPPPSPRRLLGRPRDGESKLSRTFPMLEESESENFLTVPQLSPVHGRTPRSPTHSPRSPRPTGFMPVLTESFEEESDEDSSM